MLSARALDASRCCDAVCALLRMLPMRLKLCTAIVAVAFARRGDAAPCRRRHAADCRDQEPGPPGGAGAAEAEGARHADRAGRDDAAALGGARRRPRAGASAAARRRHQRGQPLRHDAARIGRGERQPARHRGVAAGWRRRKGCDGRRRDHADDRVAHRQRRGDARAARSRCRSECGTRNGTARRR